MILQLSYICIISWIYVLTVISLSNSGVLSNGWLSLVEYRTQGFFVYCLLLISPYQISVIIHPVSIEGNTNVVDIGNVTTMLVPGGKSHVHWTRVHLKYQYQPPGVQSKGQNVNPNTWMYIGHLSVPWTALTHLPLVPHICVSELDHHLFR